jgi:hypothetical protein
MLTMTTARAALEELQRMAGGGAALVSIEIVVKPVILPPIYVPPEVLEARRREAEPSSLACGKKNRSASDWKL